MTAPDITRQTNALATRYAAIIAKYDLRGVNMPPFLTATPLDQAKAMHAIFGDKA